MRILLITTLYPGYINQSKIKATYAVHYLAREWANDNEVKVIRLWPYYPKVFNFFKKGRNKTKYSYEKEFILDGVNIYRIPILKIPKINYRNKDIKQVSEKIMEIIKEKGIPDVIICDILNPSIYIGEIIARKNHCMLIASLHNSDIFYLLNNKNYKKYIKIDQNIDKIVFRSTRIKKDFLNLYNGNKKDKDYFKILFGIDRKDIMDKNKIEEKILKPNKVIITVSSLKKLKKTDILIEAFTKLENKNGYVLKIIGDGPERTNLEKQAKNLGYENYIHFEGEKSREDVLNLMEKADIFAMVSSPETFGLVYIEAMAKGCLTIGSKGEGIDGVIINNKNGFLCIPNDVENLKTTLEDVITLSIKEKKRIINNAINTASRLNNEELANEYLENIQEALKA